MSKTVSPITFLSFVALLSVVALLALCGIPQDATAFTIIVNSSNQSDAFIRQSTATTNYGTADAITFGRRQNADRFRGLVWFNLSGLPEGIRIDNATLWLYFLPVTGGQSTAAIEARLHTVNTNRDWVENQVTWNNYKTGSAWTTAGGDYAAVNTANATFSNASANSYIIFNVTRDVGLFANGTAPNWGWVVRTAESANNQVRNFSSREAAQADRKPKIVLNVTDIWNPSVFNVTPQGGNYRNDTVVAIRANITDNIGVDKAFVNITLPNGTVRRFALVNATRTSFEYNYTPTQVGIHDVLVVANDTSGLVNASATGWFNVTGGVKLTVVSPLAGAVVLINETPVLNVSIESDVVITSVFANITKPDRTNQIVYLSQAGNNWNADYGDVMLAGRYNITYVMNDDGDDRTTATTHFIRQPVDILDVVDGSGSTINFTRSVLNNRSGILDLLINTSGAIKSVLVRNHSQASGRTVLRIRNGSNEWPGLHWKEYGVDLSDINATSADVRVNAVGTTLFKCAEYNISAGQCPDQQNYTILRENLVPGTDYVITLFPGDPGFGETISGPDNTTDSYLRQQAPNTNYGAATQIIVGTANNAARRNRGIIWFNISKIVPAYTGIRIDNATIELYYEQNTDGAAGSITHNIHRVQQSPVRNWNESTVTWNNWNTTGAWTVAGGDFTNAATASAITTATTGVWIKFNVTIDAQNFVDTSATNFGWLINSTSEATTNTRRAYSSSESATAAQRPRLIINWSDISPPNVTNVLPQGTTYNQTATITIRANVTDNILVDKVYANITMPNGSIAFISMVNVTATAWQCNFSQTSGAGLYTMLIMANDTSGLLNNTETGSFTINGTAAVTGYVNITALTATPDPQGYGLVVRIVANVTNATAVWVGITPPGQGETNYSMTLVNGYTYEYNFTGWLNGTHLYTIYANGTLGDTARNSSNFTLRQELAFQINTLQTQYAANETIYLTDPPGDNRMIRSATIDPNKVHPGERTRISVHAVAVSGIRSVVARMPTEVGVDIVELALASGTDEDGIWQASWQAHDTISKDYVSTIVATGRNGMSEEAYVTWQDPPSLWLIPTSVEQQGTVWTNTNNARDGDTDTYASDTRNLAGWSEFIIFNITQIESDRVRVWCDYDVQVNAIDVDVFRNGAWENAYQGPAINLDWMQVNITLGNITAGRFRYNYSIAGWTYWLYEFQFYNLTSQVNLPIVSTKPATSIEQTTANIHGVVGSDGGEACSIRFLYGTTTAYGSSTAWEGQKYTDDPHSVRITGLSNGVTYNFMAQIENSAGRTNGSNLLFTTAAPGPGWVSPTGYSDTSGRWIDGDHAIDDETKTDAYCYHNVNDPEGTWSPYLYLDRSPSMLVNRIRFYARATNTDNASVDVLVNGTVWQTVYTGAFADKTWIVATFNTSNVTQARIRLEAANNGEGFNFRLYEFDYYQVVSTPPEEQSKMENLANVGGTDASCYLSMRTQYWDGGAWLYDDVVVNDTTARVLAPEDILKLDTIWNPYNYSTRNLSYGDGVYRIYAACTDGMGNVLMNRNGSYVNATANFTVDASPPSVTLIQPPNGTSYPLASAIPIAANITDYSNMSSVVVNVTTPVITEQIALSYNATTGLWEGAYANTYYVGAYTFLLIATDLSGNVNDTQRSTVFVIDTAPPVVTLVAPPDGAVNDTQSPVNVIFRCNATDNYDVRNISLYITNAQNQSFALYSTTTVSGVNTFAVWNLSLYNGNYSWNCLAWDSQGGYSDWGDYNWSVRVNYTDAPPAVTLLAPADRTNATQTWHNFSWYATDNANTSLVCNLTIDSVVNSSYVVTLNNTPVNVTVNAFTDGFYTWNVSCYDGTSWNTSVRNRFKVDTKGPWFDNSTETPASVAPYGTTSVDLSISANDALNAVDKVWVLFNSTRYEATLINGRYNVTVAGVVNGGGYHYNWSGNDTLGNTNTTATFPYNVSDYYFAPILSFTLTLPGQGAVIANSSQNGTTATMFFNSSTNTFYNMDPCVQGTSFCQNGTTPFFSYVNTGTLNLTMSIFLESALPAVFSLKANVTNATMNASIITTSPMIIARNMTPNTTQPLWFFGDFINAFPSDNTIRNLTSEGTG